MFFYFKVRTVSETQGSKRREQSSHPETIMPYYLTQTEALKTKPELIKSAIAYYYELVKQKYTLEKARKKVIEKMGVVL